jgi:hypothetical protein
VERRMLRGYWRWEVVSEWPEEGWENG